MMVASRRILAWRPTPQEDVELGDTEQDDTGEADTERGDTGEGDTVEEPDTSGDADTGNLDTTEPEDTFEPPVDVGPFEPGCATYADPVALGELPRRPGRGVRYCPRRVA